MTLELRHADDPAAVEACIPVLRQLRPHLADIPDIPARIARQQAEGYRLLAAWHDGSVAGIAGYRMQDNLIYGRFCYVDDLAVLETARAAGLGAFLLDAVKTEAATAGCARLVLDTGLANARAQRFLFRCGLLTSAIRFDRPLP